MSRRQLQELIKNLQEFYKCPSCDTHYHFDDIKVLGQIDQYCFVQLGCHSCSMPVLATVSIGVQKRTKLKTDLVRNESSKFARKGSITAGEIAEFHRYLTQTKGGFGKLVKKSSK
jgi:hypothetical protein